MVDGELRRKQRRAVDRQTHGIDDDRRDHTSGHERILAQTSLDQKHRAQCALIARQATEETGKRAAQGNQRDGNTSAWNRFGNSSSAKIMIRMPMTTLTAVTSNADVPIT